MNKTLHFNARYGGWCYLNQSDQWCRCPPPFATHKQAVDYALSRLRTDKDSPYSVIVDARAALEWAAALDKPSIEECSTVAIDDKRTCNDGLQVPPLDPPARRKK